MTTRELNRRQQLIWELFDFSVGHGLEIGPLHNLCVPKDAGEVSYLDVFDRDQLVRNYADDPGVPVELIPEIDYVLTDGERVRSIPETIGGERRFDWVMASHVIEHVPDVIGWLDQIASVAVDGAALVLAVPDRRYCFDLHRPGTSLGQMLQAHDLGETTPSIRAVYDYKRGFVSVRAPDVWNGHWATYRDRVYDFETAREQVERVRNGEYVDSHVWLFTPGTFLEQVIELRELGLGQWRVETLLPTKRDQLEFHVVLRRLPRDGWSPDLIADEPKPGEMPDWLAEVVELRTSRDSFEQKLGAAESRADELRAEAEALRSELTTTQYDLDSARRAASRLRERVSRLETERSRRLDYRVKQRLRESRTFAPVLSARRAVRRRRTRG